MGRPGFGVLSQPFLPEPEGSSHGDWLQGGAGQRVNLLSH